MRPAFRQGVLALFAVALPACQPSEPVRVPARLPLSVAMSPGDATGFERAVEPRAFSFPNDHGPHPGFRTEWWYLTGNLESDDATGRRFGYQITFFRSALSPPPDASKDEPSVEERPAGDGSAPDRSAEGRPAARSDDPGSAWRTGSLFMGHLALTDVEAGEFYAFERFSRQAGGLAGAEVRPFRVWLEDWSLEAAGDSTEKLFPLRIVAGDGDIALDLALVPEKPVVLQGDEGLSRKGSREGNASYYYSFTRLATTGTVRVGERRYQVGGSSWFDREWSTSALEPGVVGWDWFALQLSDGRDLMVYRLRRDDAVTDPASAGVIVETDGAYRTLGAADFQLVETERWRSPETGVVYPAGWRLESPAAGVALSVEPLVAAQEHTDSVLYWEGAVRVEGTSDGARVEGRGYVELTGYETG